MLIFRIDLDGRIAHGEKGQDDTEGSHEQEEEDGGQTELVTGRLPLRHVLPQLGQHRLTQRPVNGKQCLMHLNTYIEDYHFFTHLRE